MTDEKLYWIQDDTNNGPWEVMPDIDPVVEARLMAECEKHWDAAVAESEKKKKEPAIA